MKKTILILGMMAILALSVFADDWTEIWNSRFNAKMPTTEFYDEYYIDIIDEDIVKESNKLSGNARYIMSDDEDDLYVGRINYNGKIYLEDGEIKYKLNKFKVDYTDIDEDMTEIGGDAVMEYTLVIKKEVPVYATAFVDEYNGEAFIEIEGTEEDFYYFGELSDGGFKRTVSQS